MCSENIGANQLRNYCEADQRLCFRTRHADCWFSDEAAHIFLIGMCLCCPLFLL